jgi:hypothetical protein
MRPVVGIWVAVVCFGAWAGVAAAEVDSDSLDGHLREAKADLRAGWRKAAGKQLVWAARPLEKKVYPASGEVKQALVKNAVALKSLAAEVEKGYVSDPQAIDASAGRAHAVLAKFHQVRAELYLSKEKARNAGRELRAAAHHLERGAVWLGRGSDTDVLTATSEAVVLSDQLVEAGYAPEDDVDNVLEAVGREIDRLGWDVESRQARRAPARHR